MRWGASAADSTTGLASEGKDYWRTLLKDGPATVAPNFRVTPGTISCQNAVFPITATDRPAGNAYPCSLHTQYVRYPVVELGLIASTWKRLAARLALHFLRWPLACAALDRTVQWNSWLLSTNLISDSLPYAIADATSLLVEHCPNHAVLLKNINVEQHQSLLSALKESGYTLITSRIVYLFDGQSRSYLQKSPVKRDRKLIAERSEYQLVEHEDFTLEDVPRITHLYHKLYLEKHSMLNPQYTDHFVEHALERHWLEFRGLRHRSGRIDAVYGCFQMGNTLSTPFVGYDTSLPQDAGLYRMLVAMLLERTAEKQLLLNYSSGAGEFKRRRGGTPAMEFNAVYTKHLPAIRQAGFQLLTQLVNRIAAPFMIREGL